MIRLCTAFFFVGLLAAHATGQARPRLAVLCSVDQLAAWVHALGRPFYAEDGGFRRLEREGVT
ncbi:MAG: hypothetical protein VYD05_14835, partial [Planctomycetota bacterium]|nr:hypothetical protein [Planctomycetota bacterium]